MTTIITHNGKMVADRLIFHKPLVGASYFSLGKTKIYKSECGRAAFCFYYELPISTDIPKLVIALTDALTLMHVNNTYPVIYLSRETILAIPKDIYINMAIKDNIYIFAKLDNFTADNNVREAESGKIFDLVISRMDPDDFNACGSGQNFAIGIHLTDPNIPIEKMIPIISQHDNRTSKEFDFVDSAKLKPLIVPVPLPKGKKNVKRK